MVKNLLETAYIDGAKKIGLKVVEYNNYLKLKTKADYKILEFSELLNFI